MWRIVGRGDRRSIISTSRRPADGLGTRLATSPQQQEVRMTACKPLLAAVTLAALAIGCEDSDDRSTSARRDRDRDGIADRYDRSPSSDDRRDDSVILGRDRDRVRDRDTDRLRDTD